MTSFVVSLFWSLWFVLLSTPISQASHSLDSEACGEEATFLVLDRLKQHTFLLTLKVNQPIALGPWILSLKAAFLQTKQRDSDAAFVCITRQEDLKKTTSSKWPAYHGWFFSRYPGWSFWLGDTRYTLVLQKCRSSTDHASNQSIIR